MTATPLDVQSNLSSAEALHWIVGAAQRAKLAGAEALRMPVGQPGTTAWEYAARILGMSQPELTASLATAMHMRAADMRAADRQTRRLVPERLARRYKVFPLSETDRSVVIATSDPYDLNAEQDIAFAAGRRVMFELATPQQIEDAIASAYSPDRAVETLLLSAPSAAEEDVRVIADDSPEEISGHQVETGPVVRLTNLIIATAVRQRASDVHMEPGPQMASIRFRIDGVLRHHMDVPVAVINRIISRIKVLAKLDIADRMRPQDGRTRIQVDNLAVDLRVSTIPTRESEKAVIRLLRPDATRSLEEIGVPTAELNRFRAMIGHRDGIVIVTGPTGSGKTTTMYAAIREIADGTVNVMTVEDPIEYELPGITQMQTEPKRGVTFPTALRAILRQDPDVIFVGEIRDLETAEVAVQASLTGHLVLATLHTNDAVGAVSRLADFGIDRTALAETLRGCIAQRLVRKVCAHCAQKVGEALTPKETSLVERFGVRPVVRAIGCDKCGNTGYSGRTPIDEVVTFTPAIAELVSYSAPSSALQRAASSAGMRSLREVGLEVVANGGTTLEEIDRVLGDSGEEAAAVTASLRKAASSDPSVKTIMIVDDDAVQRLMAEAVLTGSGYGVITAANGLEAIELLVANPETALIVTDLDMPQMDGQAFLARVRHHPTFSSLPMIVLTGNADTTREFSLMDAGADDYLRKPVDPQRLVARVKAALRRAQPIEIAA
jgi:type II secretory ATPase GspE/PulE/Tfp pilus assembly ATPase PilB-like protein/ActR/RegA family two-component response regulator